MGLSHREARARLGLVMGCAAALLLVVLSPAFGRAEPSGRYRPDLPPDALTTGCYPLPAGLTIDFPYQVRADGDVGVGRRVLVLQYDEVDAATVRDRLAAALRRAGFRERRSARPPGTLTFARQGVGWVRATVTPLDRVSVDDLVRGSLELDLPRVERQSDAPECFDPFSTKRFADGAVTR